LSNSLKTEKELESGYKIISLEMKFSIRSNACSIFRGLAGFLVTKDKNSERFFEDV